MKINLIPSNKLAMFSAAVCAVMLAFSHNASAVTIGDNQYLGTMGVGGGANNDAMRTDYTNHLIGMNAPSQDTFDLHLFTRSSNTFGPLPTAVFALTVVGTTTVSLGAGGTYSYLFAWYGSATSPLIAHVWYVGNLSGNITVPLPDSLVGWTLFGPGGVPGVPDGGTTVMLLGAALGALGMARRFLKA